MRGIDWNKLINEEAVAKHTKPIELTEDWVSYRYPPDPLGASKQPARFNLAGQSGIYLASGIECAQAEVPTHEARVLYEITPKTIHVFDIVSFAEENGLEDVVKQTKEGGGHELCQELSSALTTDYGITGVFYESCQMAKQGKSGFCVCVLPRPDQTIDGSFMHSTV